VKAVLEETLAEMTMRIGAKKKSVMWPQSCSKIAHIISNFIPISCSIVKTCILSFCLIHIEILIESFPFGKGGLRVSFLSVFICPSDVLCSEIISLCYPSAGTQ